MPDRPREAALHQAATRLFRERGFHATSMQDLAEALGINRGSLYHYIESKDDLLWAIVFRAMERLDARVRPVLEADGSAIERLERGIDAHLAFAVEHGDELSLSQIELRSLDDRRRREIVRLRDAYEAAWRATIDDGVGRGELRALDVRLATIAILSACNWFTQWFRPDGRLTAHEVGRAFSGLYLGGMRADDAGRVDQPFAATGAGGSGR